MTTPRQYSVVDDWVYKTDILKKKTPLRSGDTFFEDSERKTGQEYKVIKTVDTNDPKNSQGYDRNGFQGMAVAPIVNGKTQYDQIIIAYAGTNPNDWTLNDLLTDGVNVGAGFKQLAPGMDSQFTSAQQFYQEVAIDFGAKNIDSITGHSLGGALAQKVGAANHIPTVTFSSASVGSQLTKSEKAWINGEGKKFVLNFMHKGDQISAWTKASKYGTSIFAGDFGDGSLLSGHFFSSYRFDKNGSLIDDAGDVWEITDEGTLKKGIDLVQDVFKAKINDLKALKKKFSASGSGLSSAEKIYLDDSQALAVVSTASTEFDLAMVNLMKVYQNGIKEAEKLWETTISQARQIGTLLQDGEIYDALEMMGFTYETIVEIPSEEYQDKIDKIRQMSEQFKELESKIITTISELVAKDTELGQQLKM